MSEILLKKMPISNRLRKKKVSLCLFHYVRQTFGPCLDKLE